MHPVTAVVIVFGCLTVGGSGYPRLPTFPSCQLPVCHSGASTGYSCHDGDCDFVCSQFLCRGAANSVLPQRAMQEVWGSGALGVQGCYGGNCGYWGGCKEDKCEGFYDFKQCRVGECVSGQFQGYGCTTSGNCNIVCHDGVCHVVDYYGKLYQPTLVSQQEAGREDVIFADGSDASKASVWEVIEYLFKVDAKDSGMSREPIPNADDVVASLEGGSDDIGFLNVPQFSGVTLKLRRDTTESLVSMLRKRVQKSFKSDQGKGGASTDGSNEGSYVWQELGELWGQGAATLVGGVQGYALPTHPMVGVGRYYGYGYAPMTAYDTPYYGDALQPQLQMLGIHIPVHTIDPSVLQSTLLQMPNAHQLIMSVNPMLLQSALMHVPGWGSCSSSMDANALQSMIAGLPYINEIPETRDPVLLQYIIVSIPNTDSMMSGVGPSSNQTTMPTVTSHERDATESAAAMSEPPTETPDDPNLVDFNVTQFILSTVPSIPPQYANVLLNMDPGFVQFIIKNHHNLPDLLASMNAQTLLYVTAHVPTFGTILSNLSRNALEVIFAKLTNIDGFLEDMDPEVVQAIAAKVPSLGKYAPPESTTTTLPESSTLEPKLDKEVTEDVLTTAAAIAPLSTDEELELVRSKIPLFDEALKWADPEKVVVLRKLVPDYPEIITNMKQETLEAINSNLHTATKLIQSVREMLLQGAYGKSMKEGNPSNTIFVACGQRGCLDCCNKWLLCAIQRWACIC
ncbi:hypothetical protein TSMEX_007633 [Taenia solium]|eukprot:TsM_001226700 transcript=TsM_001226700 gene=TsM_001226700